MNRGTGFLPRPAVSVQEGSGITPQVKVPLLKAWAGMGGSVFFLSLGAAWFLWLVPADSAFEMARFVFLVILLLSAYRATLARYDEQFWEGEGVTARADFHHSRMWAGITAAILSFALIWSVGEMGKGWWAGGEKTWEQVAANLLLYTVQWSFSLGMVMGCGYGVYWFGKEIRNPWELTGKDRVDFLIKRRELDLRQQELDRLRALDEIEAMSAKAVRYTYTEPGKGNGQGPTTTMFDLDRSTDSQFDAFCTAILEMTEPDFGYRRWTGRGKVYTRDQFDEVRDEMKARGVARRARSGKLILTTKGRNMLGGWLLARGKSV